MKNDMFDLKYTLCFPIKENKVLMIQRVKHPWKSRWNGAGGKIKEGENPKEAVYREILEEAQIDLKKAKLVTFAGIVTWDVEEEKPMRYHCVFENGKLMEVKHFELPESIYSSTKT